MELDGLPSTVIHPPAVTLTFDLLTPKSNNHINEPKYICDHNLAKFPSMVVENEIRCSQGFGTHRLTHSLMDGRPDHRMSLAPRFNGGKGIKRIIINQSVDVSFYELRTICF